MVRSERLTVSKQFHAGASEEEQSAVEARLAGRIPWLVQSEQWTHRLAALSLSKASPTSAGLTNCARQKASRPLACGSYTSTKCPNLLTGIVPVRV